MCEIDWNLLCSFLSAIGSVVTAVVAIYAYHKWKNPKISEIVSQEARKLLIDIEDFRFQLIEIHENLSIECSDESELKTLSKELKKILRKVYSQDRLLNGLTGVKNESRSDTQKILTQYKEKINSFCDLNFKDRDSDPEFQQLIKNFDRDFLESRLKIIEHFNYGKKII